MDYCTDLATLLMVGPLFGLLYRHLVFLSCLFILYCLFIFVSELIFFLFAKKSNNELLRSTVDEYVM